jgi:hypothetical protein
LLFTFFFNVTATLTSYLMSKPGIPRALSLWHVHMCHHYQQMTWWKYLSRVTSPNHFETKHQRIS